LRKALETGEGTGRLSPFFKGQKPRAAFFTRPVKDGVDPPPRSDLREGLIAAANLSPSPRQCL
jgi:hypothetical protein